MKMNDSLGDRMKMYEQTSDYRLSNRIPIIIRIDGKAFHSWTKKSKCVVPFDSELMNLMADTTKYLCENISGCILGYCQSDEISLCVINTQNSMTQAWFDNRIQKMTSISASLATYFFNAHNPKEIKIPAFFDSRVFLIPEKDVMNYFIWRQRDATRNSISMLAQSLYSHKELHMKSSDEKQQLCWEKGMNWNNLPSQCKRGSLIYKVLETEPLINKQTGEKTFRKKFKIDTESEVFKYDENTIIGKILKENSLI